MYTIVVLLCSALTCTTSVKGDENGHTVIYPDKAACEQGIKDNFGSFNIPEGQIADAQCVSWFKA